MTYVRRRAMWGLLGLWGCGEPIGVIHKSTGLLGSAQALAAMIDNAELDRAIMYSPAAILALNKAHQLANQRLTQIDLGPTPPHCPLR